MAKEGGVGVGCIAHHAIVSDVHGVRDSIAPERGRLDVEVRDRATRRIEHCERQRAAVAVQAGVVRVVVPPRLSSRAWSVTVLKRRVSSGRTCPFPWIPPVLWASTVKSLPVTTNQDAWSWVDGKFLGTGRRKADVTWMKTTRYVLFAFSQNWMSGTNCQECSPLVLFARSRVKGLTFRVP